MDSDTVLGHYVADASGQWVPALQQSTELFKAVVNDDISKFERELDALGSGLLGAFTILYWSEGKGGEQATPQVQAKARTLLALAVYHGSLRVLSHLLSKGANPKAGQDGQNAYEVGVPLVFVDSIKVMMMIDRSLSLSAHQISL